MPAGAEIRRISGGARTHAVVAGLTGLMPVGVGPDRA